MGHCAPAKAPALACFPVHLYRSPIRGILPITSKNTSPRQKPITWHTAFRDGIQLTFFPYRHLLQFVFEYPLNTEPLRIDAVIIKKQPGAVIENPLGALFRNVNIIEYKSPGDYLSVEDYHKTGAYARLYSVLNRVESGDMTISFVGEGYPRKMLNYVKGKYGYKVEERGAGIYYVEGDICGVQVIETKRLGGGGEWLRDLRGGLKGEELRGIMERWRGMPAGTPLGAYIPVVLRANGVVLEEMVEMPNITFEEVLERHGFTTKWKEEGR
ncbi:MAG: hypothetical protein LBG07_07215 [Treponema sp.]|jgi:hypothetical protein|nr:hypothetical protein [Treponema sp.]